jgi:hypothetical protein
MFVLAISFECSIARETREQTPCRIAVVQNAAVCGTRGVYPSENIRITVPAATSSRRA